MMRCMQADVSTVLNGRKGHRTLRRKENWHGRAAFGWVSLDDAEMIRSARYKDTKSNRSVLPERTWDFLRNRPKYETH